MSSTAGNFFGGTLGVLTALLLFSFIIVALPIFICMGGCAGCVGIGAIGVGGAASQQAEDARRQAKEERERPTKPKPVKTSPIVIVEPEAIPELPLPNVPMDIPLPEKPIEPVKPEVPAVPNPDFGRQFTSRTGSQMRAKFIEFRFQGSRVILEKEDGSELDVSMNDLSKSDQDWIREEVKRRAKER